MVVWCCVDEKSHRQQWEHAQRPKGGQELGMLGEERKSSGGIGSPGHLKAAPSGVVLFKLCQEQVDQRRESMSLCVPSTSP